MKEKKTFKQCSYFVSFLYLLVCVYFFGVSLSGVAVSVVRFAPRLDNFHAKNILLALLRFLSSNRNRKNDRTENNKSAASTTSNSDDSSETTCTNGFRLCVFVVFICVMCAFSSSYAYVYYIDFLDLQS